MRFHIKKKIFSIYLSIQIRINQPNGKLLDEEGLRHGGNSKIKIHSCLWVF